MAAPACMSDDGNPAVFVGTFLKTGDSIALCDDCMVPWTAAVLSTMTGVDPAPFIAAVSEDVPGAAEGAPTDEPPPEQPADSDQPAHPTPIRKGGRGSKESHAPPTDTENPADVSGATDGDTTAVA